MCLLLLGGEHREALLLKLRVKGCYQLVCTGDHGCHLQEKPNATPSICTFHADANCSTACPCHHNRLVSAQVAMRAGLVPNDIDTLIFFNR